MNDHLSAPHTADHWWWRPGWGIGTRCFTFHLTFQDQPALHAHADAWRKRLAPFDQLDPVPQPWLHLTIQGVGLKGQVDPDDVDAIAEHAAVRIGSLPAFDLTVDRPTLTPEAVQFEVGPAEPVAAVRTQLRAAIGQVWPHVPESADGFVPHISLAYGNRAADASEIAAAIDAAPRAPSTLRISHVDLILLGRDQGVYTWDSLAQLPLRG